MVVARVFSRALDDLVVRELARGLLDQALLVGQLEVHVRFLSAQLRRFPRRRDAPLDLLRDALDRQALLRQRIPIAQRDGPILRALMIDRKAERRTDLVLTA